MSLPLYSSYSVNPDLYAYALSSAYRSGWRVLEPNIALRDDPDAYEKALRDPVIRQAVDQNLRSIAGRVWNVLPFSDTPNDKSAAKIVEHGLKQIREFGESRYTAAKARFTSRSYHFIEGERHFIQLGDAPPMEWWVPVRLRECDSRRFRYAPVKTIRPDGGTTTSVREEMWSWERTTWEPLAHPECFLKIVYNDEESRLSYGRGLLESMHFYLWIKGVVLRDGLQGLKRWAQGRVHVKVDGLRKASTDRDNDTIQTSWLNVIKKAASENVVVFDKLDDVEVLETSGTGHSIVEFFLKYLDEGMVRLINGAVLPNGMGSDTGSNARAKTEDNNSESIVQFDRDKLDENISIDVIGQFWRLNRGNFAMCGIADARKPRFETVQQKREDPMIAAGVVEILLRAQVPLRQDDVYEKTGFKPPNEGDAIFEGAAPVDQFGGDPNFNGDAPPGGDSGENKPPPNLSNRNRRHKHGRR